MEQDNKNNASDEFCAYPDLMMFCGGIASACSAVESNFSIVKWWSLTNFSHEGILHCEQFEKLSEITDDTELK